MLSLFGRATVGRTVSAAAAVSSASQIIVPVFVAAAGPPRVRRLAPIARSFSASAWIRFPAAGSGASKKKKTTTAGAAKKKKTAVKKKKPAAKKKKAAAKKKPAAAKKKTLTPEQKQKKELSQLRKMALPKAPKGKPVNGWTVFVTDNVAGGSGGASLPDKVKDLAVQFKSLSESEKARLNERAQANVEANKQALKQWIESYPAGAIYLANLARRRLARKLEKKRPLLLHDSRLPKGAPSAYSLFIKSHHDQVSAESPKDTFRQLAQQWKALPESEKQHYKETAGAESAKVRRVIEDLREKGKAYWADKGL